MKKQQISAFRQHLKESKIIVSDWSSWKKETTTDHNAVVRAESTHRRNINSPVYTTA